MSFRFITKSIHAYLIRLNPIALVLMVAPFVLEARPERTGRTMAFGRHRRRSAALGRVYGPPDRLGPHHPLLAAPMGRPCCRPGLHRRTICLELLRTGRLVLLGPRRCGPTYHVGLQCTRGAFCAIVAWKRAPQF